MQHSVTCDYKHDMFFEADVDGHKLGMDATQDRGGHNLGPRPKPLLLAAISGCTGMDVVSILNKMKVPFASLKISVSGTLTDVHPMYYKDIHIIYEFGGKDLQAEAIEKAIKLSQEKYCGVTASLSKSANITYEIKYP